MRIALIAAMTKNNVIGNQNKLPWHFPEELKYFKKITLGKPIIMGRKTFESMGSRPLPNRPNIILTQDKHFLAEGCTIVHSVEEALKVASNKVAGTGNNEEIMVIGGAKIYQQFLPLASRLYLTIIHEEYTGDAYFPVVDWQDWQSISEEIGNDYTIKVFEKHI